jgi:hypothetical protein
MAINRLLLTFTIVISSLVFSSGVSLALATADGSSGSTFVWSQVSPIVGAKLKVSEVVSSSRKGTRAYRASGVCSLRKGVLSFNRTGKCRISVSVKLNSNGKVLRSSKVLMVKAKAEATSPAASGLPDPISCIKASSDPLTGRNFPDSAPGVYEFQTGWNCDYASMDARPLLEYYKSQGWVQKSTTSGMSSADLYKGSDRIYYGPSFENMPAGQALLILTIY